MPAPPPTLHDLLRQQSQRWPNRGYRFLGSDGNVERSLDYPELLSRAHGIGSLLQDGLARPGDRALLLYDDIPSFVEAFYACAATGVVAVPVPAPHPARFARQLPRLQAIVRDAGPALVLTTESIARSARPLLGRAPDLGELRWLATDTAPVEPDSWVDPELGGDDLALLQYTSGSTGTPTGVVIRHRHLLYNLQLISTGLVGLGDAHRMVSWLPVFHDLGLIGGMRSPLYDGGECFMMSPVQFLRDPSLWMRAVSRHGATVSGGPNFAYELCASRVTDRELASLDLRRLSTAYCGAEPIRSDTVERFTRRFGIAGFAPTSFRPCYGMAETTLIVSGEGPLGSQVLRVDAEALAEGRATPSDAPDATPLVHCGPILGDYELAIVDGTGSRLLGDRVGEIWLRGSSVGDGYWHRGEQSAEAFDAQLDDGSRGWLRTGDLGFVAPDGGLCITGRCKDLLILRGRNVYPHDLEHTAEAAGLYVRAGGSAAVGTAVGGEERLVFVAELDQKRAPEGFDLDQATRSLRAVLAEVHDVAAVGVVWIAPGAMPKTPSGKVMRANVAAWYEAGAASALHRWQAAEQGGLRLSTKPDGASLVQAMATWLASHVGVTAQADSSLRALGLDSLQVVQLTDALREALVQPALSPGAVLDAPTLQALAEMLVAMPPHVPRGTTPPPLRRARTAPSRQVLSLWQQAVLAWEIRRPPNSTWVDLYRVYLTGPLFRADLRRALTALCRRQSALLLHVTRGGLAQGPKPPEDIVLRFLDLRNASVAELDARIEALASEPMSLDGQPLLEVHLWQHADEEHTLLLRWHQLVQDGTGGSQLANELLELYAARRQGRDDTLPTLSIHYHDYASWERAHYREKGAARVEAERARLRDLPATELPGEAPAAPATYGVGGDAVLDPLSTEALRRRIDTASVTFYDAMACVTALLLASFTGSAHVSFLSPTSVRTRRELLPVIGRFGAWAPIHLQVRPEETLADLLAQLQSQHELLDDPIPGALLFDTDDPFDHPVGQVILNTPNPDGATALQRTAAELVVDGEPLYKPYTSRSQLSLVFFESRGHLLIRITGAPGRFDTDTLRSLRRAAAALITRFDAGERIGDLLSHDLDGLALAQGAFVTEPPNHVVRTPSFLRGDPLQQHPKTTQKLVATEEAFLSPDVLRALYDRDRRPIDQLDNELIDLVFSGVPYGRYLVDQLLADDDRRLQAMDAAGIDHAVLSVVSPGVQLLPTAQATELAAKTNDWLAERCRRHPDRFSGLATIDPSDPVAAAAEFRRAVVELGLCGALINSHTQGVYLDDPRCRPILTTANELHAPIYLHPRNPPASARAGLLLHGGDRLTEVMWGFHADAGLHVARLLVSGVLDAYPHVRILLGHLGEGVPGLLFRMDWAARVNYRLRRTPSETFRHHFFVTTSGIYDDPVSHEALMLCHRLLGPERILFAADHPFARGAEATAALMAAPLSDEDRERIAWQNAHHLFGLRSF